ncbi:low choriolytic enzyme-like [Rhizophagus clarus]|uniref:Metalloendopeptidase n=1 Tax=Rhizophagus clarus TaxID=94130 RepID=A0A8H3KZE6_9GLOM|nr:low choriolytic enzyme-like [Rhizophagus clarus]
MCEPCFDLCTNDSKKLWRKGIVPYEFNKGVSKNLVRSVKKAMKKISIVSTIRFVKKTDQLDYIEIVNKRGYWSYVGKRGGKQELSVTEGWPNPIGCAIHELMHALGFYHEHCRPDRDKYVTVEDNIKENINYKIIKESDALCFDAQIGQRFQRFFWKSTTSDDQRGFSGKSDAEKMIKRNKNNSGQGITSRSNFLYLFVVGFYIVLLI